MMYFENLSIVDEANGLVSNYERSERRSVFDGAQFGQARVESWKSLTMFQGSPKKSSR